MNRFASNAYAVTFEMMRPGARHIRRLRPHKSMTVSRFFVLIFSLGLRNAVCSISKRNEMGSLHEYDFETESFGKEIDDETN